MIILELTAVESLEARVISKLPFRPSRAGTKMKISLISMYTGQCYNMTHISRYSLLLKIVVGAGVSNLTLFRALISMD